MRQVEVFVTNVGEIAQANALTMVLRNSFPHYSINFDLEDCDRIMRVESDRIDSQEIIRILNRNNFNCEILP